MSGEIGRPTFVDRVMGRHANLSRPSPKVSYTSPRSSPTPNGYTSWPLCGRHTGLWADEGCRCEARCAQDDFDRQNAAPRTLEGVAQAWDTAFAHCARGIDNQLRPHVAIGWFVVAVSWPVPPSPARMRRGLRRGHAVALRAEADVEDQQTVFLKTIIPRRKATKQYLGEESDDET